MSPAALFVRKRSVYARLGCDLWPEERDARLYDGDAPVIAHPPCQRWGRFWSGGPSHAGQFRLGDDGGCFRAALRAVRRVGGILEHPADSRAWKVFKLTPPPPSGRWEQVAEGVWTVEVFQGAYGHLARKRTWLWAHFSKAPPLEVLPLPPGRVWREVTHLCRAQRESTPPMFAAYLCSLVRSCCLAPPSPGPLFQLETSHE